MYYERSDDPLRTGARSPFWTCIEVYMTANNIPWIEEALDRGAVSTPINRRDVRGAAIGSSTYNVPAGRSIYQVPGWTALPAKRNIKHETHF